MQYESSRMWRDGKTKSGRVRKNSRTERQRRRKIRTCQSVIPLDHLCVWYQRGWISVTSDLYARMCPEISYHCHAVLFSPLIVRGRYALVAADLKRSKYLRYRSPLCALEGSSFADALTRNKLLE